MKFTLNRLIIKGFAYLSRTSKSFEEFKFKRFSKVQGNDDSGLRKSRYCYLKNGNASANFHYFIHNPSSLDPNVLYNASANKYLQLQLKLQFKDHKAKCYFNKIFQCYEERNK